MSSQPKVAIVVVNWNKKNYVIDLLASLKNIDYDNFETIIVDNASEDDSVNAIKNQFPDTQLLVNSKNLGGTAGFNSGMKYALEKAEFQYIWLLDNDAKIEKNTLIELVKAMEKIDNAGIAGSRIVDTEEEGMTVALGGKFKWNTIGVIPYYRNKRDIKQNDPKEVDYVAICSALVRTSTLTKVGLMDERLFFFWDDMDWGLSFKDKGFRVIAIPQSVVYHPSFTEKRRGRYLGYYGIRNSLLVYTKHTHFLRRLFIFHNYFRYFFKALILKLFDRSDKDNLISIIALKDFCHNKWGKLDFDQDEEFFSNPPYENLSPDEDVKNLLLIAGDIKENVLCLDQKVKELFPKAKIELLVRSDREDVFKPYFNKMFILSSNKSNKMYYNIWIFFKVLLSNFDVVVSPSLSPFAFAVRRTFLYNSNLDTLEESNSNYLNTHKLIISSLLGELASLLVTPYIYLKSFKYK
jgi:hypothetical protein